MLDGQRPATSRLEDAQAGFHAHPRRHALFDDLHVNLAHVVAHPFVEDLDQELAVLQRQHRPIMDEVGRRALRRRLGAGAFRLEVPAFDDRNELHPLEAFIAEEAVDIQRPVAVEAVDAAQRVMPHAVFDQEAAAVHDLVERRPAAFVHAVAVVGITRTVEADADEEIVLFEKGRPGVVDQHAVGLEGIAHGLAGRAVFLLEFDRAAEEVQPQQRGLAALPGEVYRRHLLRFDILADVCVERLVAHAPVGFARFRKEVFLVQVEAVVAIEVAQRPDGLGHHVKGDGRFNRHDTSRQKQRV